jgi:uncharacterized protein (DUF488 family)
MGTRNRSADILLYTIGHGNHPIGRFIELLKGAGVELIVDVRSVPYSRFAPQFNKRTLEAALGSAAIGYHYLGDLLGGLPLEKGRRGILSYDEAVGSESFEEGLRRLSALSRSGCSAIMCAEKDPNRCHRKHIIARAVVSRGGSVIHILEDGTLTPEGLPDLLATLR